MSAGTPNITALVKKKYDEALSAGDLFYFDSDVHTTPVRDDEKTAAMDRVAWQIRVVPALLKKPTDQQKKPAAERPQQPKADVFAPPYVPALLVKELAEFTVLVGAAAYPDFVKQTLPPSPAMIATVYTMIQEHAGTGQGAELLGFFNCGEDSGASQPHSHFQLVELASDGTTPAVPIEGLLDRIVRDGKEHSRSAHSPDYIHMLPVPWQHFVALLEPPQDESQLGSYLGLRFTQVLDAMFSAAHDLAEETGARSKRGLPSFNILLTRRALHVIPRRAEQFDLRSAKWAPFDAPDSTPDGTGTLSVNALGTCLNLRRKELDALVGEDNARIQEVLASTGVPVPTRITDAPK